MIRLVIADDQPSIIASLSAILGAEPDFDIVATADNGRAALDAVSLHRPDVLLLDVRMPNGDGLAVLAEMTKRGFLGQGRTSVLMLTTFDLDEYVEAALRAGATGFLVKSLSYEQLLASVRAVAAGDSVLAPAATRRLLDRYLSDRGVVATPLATRRLSRLTPREVEVLQLVARGLSNADIAANLSVSGHTIKTHFSSILTKTGCRGRSEAIVLAYDGGLAVAGNSGLG